MIHLILGGARSGKSAFAERCAAELACPVTCVATAEAGDAEMARRIERHRAARPAGWALVEEPLALSETLAATAAPGRCLLVDCLTLWLSNLMAAERDLRREREQLAQTLRQLPGEILLVSNEVGWDIVPANPLARRFRDEAGWLNQAVAAASDRVTLVVAGLPLSLKGTSLPR